MTDAGDLVDDCFRLRLIGTALAPVEDSVHLYHGDLGFPVVNGGEGIEAVIVEFPVAECYEALMAASVVPEQVCLGHGEGKAVVQDALQVLLVQMFLIRLLRHEEGCGRHLLGVAHDSGALTPCQCTHGLTCGNLGSLVEYDHVEQFQGRIKILGCGQGTHEHTRTEPGQESGKI